MRVHLKAFFYGLNLTSIVVKFKYLRISYGYISMEHFK